MSRVMLQAHKGVEAYFPENTMVSFNAAVKMGYDFIELDLRVTKDGEFVVLHNKTINNTARNSDGTELEKEVDISSLTFEESQKYDFGIWKGKEFKGERIPLFSSVLKLSKENGIPLKIDNKIREMTEEQLTKLYKTIKQSGAHVFISCWSLDAAKKVLNEIPDAEIHFDGLCEDKGLKELCSVVPSEKLCIWMPVDYSMASWAPKSWFLTQEKAKTIKKYCRLAIWALKDVNSFKKAAKLYKPYAAETTGTIKPEDNIEF